LFIDNPALPHHRLVRDIEQLFECVTGVDIGSISYGLGLVCLVDRRHVGILSFPGVERIRSLLEETMLI